MGHKGRRPMRRKRRQAALEGGPSHEEGSVNPTVEADDSEEVIRIFLSGVVQAPPGGAAAFFLDASDKACEQPGCQSWSIEQDYAALEAFAHAPAEAQACRARAPGAEPAAGQAGARAGEGDQGPEARGSQVGGAGAASGEGLGAHAQEGGAEPSHYSQQARQLHQERGGEY